MNKESSIGGFNSNIVLVIMYCVALFLYLINGCCYFAWAIPVLVYIFENNSDLVKRQSCQAIMLFLIGAIFSFLIYLVQLALVPVTYVQYANVTLSGVRLFLTTVCSSIYIMGNVIIFILSLIAIIRVYNYNDYAMPIIGEYVSKFKKYLDKIVGNTLPEENNDGSVSSSVVSVGELTENKKYKDTKKNTNKKVTQSEKK